MSNHGMVCNNFANNTFYFVWDKVSEFDSFALIGLGMLTQLLGNVFSIKNIYESMVEASTAEDVYAQYYDIGRLVRILVLQFEPLEAGYFNMGDYPYFNEEEISENEFTDKWDTLEMPVYDHPDLKATTTYNNSNMIEDFTSVFGILDFFRGIANGTTIISTSNLTVCEDRITTTI